MLPASALFMAVVVLTQRRCQQHSRSVFAFAERYNSNNKQNNHPYSINRIMTTTSIGKSSNLLSSKYDDTVAYNDYVSSTIELSDSYVRNGIYNVIRSVRDIDNNKRRKYVYTIPLISAVTAASDETSSSSTTSMGQMQLPPMELNESILVRLPSPSGKYLAIVRNDKEHDPYEQKKYSQILEIWSNNGQSLLRRIPLQPSQKQSCTHQKHGCVISNAGGGGFGIPSWNYDETAIVYAAERLPEETKSFFDPNNHNANDNNRNSQNTIGEQNTLDIGILEHWGEKYSKQSPILDLYIVHISTGVSERVKNVPGGGNDNDNNYYSLGQAIFSPHGNSIVYTGWDAGCISNANENKKSDMPRRLGRIYCMQRSSKIYESSIVNLLNRISQQQPSVSKDNSNEEDEEEETIQNDKDYVTLTPNYRLNVSPKFVMPSSSFDEKNPNQNKDAKLIYLSTSNHDGFDTHGGCYALHCMEYKQDKQQIDVTSHRILVHQVYNPNDGGTKNDDKNDCDAMVGKLKFPGLFLFDIPTECYVVSKKHILVTTVWGSMQKIVRISLEDGTINLVDFYDNTNKNDSNNAADAECRSDELLCITPDGCGAIIHSKSSNRPGTIYYVRTEDVCNGNSSNGGCTKVRRRLLTQMGPIACTSFAGLTASSSCINNDPPFTVQLLTIDAPIVSGVEFNEPIQCLLLMPKQSATETTKPKLIVVLHGGPHSCSNSMYLHSYSFLCGYGKYAILLINYRGSTGFGQASIESLPGHIGALDVADVVAATMHVKESGLVNKDRIGVCGGSHGGFLTAHLTGQYPDLFKAAVLRNPVINLPSMVTATDIPDWVYVEGCNGKYNWNQYRPPNIDEITKLYEKSPIRYIANVKIPSLIALGLKDLRVPPSQGLEWYHSLRSMGTVPTKLLVYDNDDHAIDTVASEADHWINIKRWFDQHL